MYAYLSYNSFLPSFLIESEKKGKEGRKELNFPPYSIDSFQRLLFFTLDYYAVFLFQIVYGAKQVHLRFQKPLLTALYYPLGIAAFILFYSLVFWVERL